MTTQNPRFNLTPFLVITALLLVFGPGCASLFPDDQDSVSTNYQAYYDYAVLANDAYLTSEEILQKYTDSSIIVRDLDDSGVRYFIKTDNESKRATVAIRGTSNLKNVIQDAEYKKEAEDITGVFFHRGFLKAATAVLEDVNPRVDKDFSIEVTGHSLGGAISVIVAAQLAELGYNVTKVITFGQPKVTNKSGVKKLRSLPLTRVINRKDPVALVPPLTFISAEHGPYYHFGSGFRIIDEFKTAPFGERESENPLIQSFWLNMEKEKLKDHSMDNYVESLRALANQEENE